jgi:glutamyl-Q tRNA(Asp) synthetase
MTMGAGRFAPSPTGPLHLGSLLAATASYLDARARGDAWYVRIDDLDVPRNAPGAVEEILRALEVHGLRWDGPVRHQQAHIPHYAAAIAELESQGHVFYCRCSRKDLPRNAPYPGTCRNRTRYTPGCTIRYRIAESSVIFDDLIQGPQRIDPAREVGDFVIRRSDGIIAYPLACALDDGAPEVTRVVRGRDLLRQTAAQLLVIDTLGLNRPEYGHLPIIVNRAGQKLSKQTMAPALDLRRPLVNLHNVLAALGSPVAGADAAGCAELLELATVRWSLSDVPHGEVPEPS